MPADCPSKFVCLGLIVEELAMPWSQVEARIKFDDFVSGGALTEPQRLALLTILQDFYTRSDTA